MIFLMEPNKESLEFGKKLLELRTQKEMSQSDVAKALKIGQTTYAGYENGKRNATTSIIKMLSNFFNVSPDYLLGAATAQCSCPPHYADLYPAYRAIVDAASIAAYEQQRSEQEGSATEFNIESNVIPIRFSEQVASAGHGVYLGPEAFEERFVVKNDLTSRATFAVPVSGDSMEPLYHDGDILLVDSNAEVDVDEIGIFTLDGHGYVKKRGYVDLVSLNPEYEPIPLDDSIRCNGKVIGVLDPEWIREDNQ